MRNTPRRIRRALLRITLSMFANTSACGGASSQESVRARPSPEPRAVAAPTVVRRGALSRAELDAVLQAGIPRFLQNVDVRGHVERGMFVGFEVVRFFPDDARFADVDLVPGDVITRVNGASIERPEDLFEVWDALRVASELVVEYKRGGETRELRFSIE